MGTSLATATTVTIITRGTTMLFAFRCWWWCYYNLYRYFIRNGWDIAVVVVLVLVIGRFRVNIQSQPVISVITHPIFPARGPWTNTESAFYGFNREQSRCFVLLSTSTFLILHLYITFNIWVIWILYEFRLSYSSIMMIIIHLNGHCRTSEFCKRPTFFFLHDCAAYF